MSTKNTTAVPVTEPTKEEIPNPDTSDVTKVSQLEPETAAQKDDGKGHLVPVETTKVVVGTKVQGVAQEGPGPSGADSIVSSGKVPAASSPVAAQAIPANLAEPGTVAVLKDGSQSAGEYQRKQNRGAVQHVHGEDGWQYRVAGDPSSGPKEVTKEPDDVPPVGQASAEIAQANEEREVQEREKARFEAERLERERVEAADRKLAEDGDPEAIKRYEEKSDRTFARGF